VINLLTVSSGLLDIVNFIVGAEWAKNRVERWVGVTEKRWSRAGGGRARMERGLQK